MLTHLLETLAMYPVLVYSDTDKYAGFVRMQVPDRGVKTQQANTLLVQTCQAVKMTR